MQIVEMILLMLTMVLASNIISRFLPNIAIPLIQVALGVIISIPTGLHSFELGSELFMLLFLAPLLFNDGANVDKKSLWQGRKAVLVLSIGLVFVTVGLLGWFIHWLIPNAPWAASFALAAALAPTDPVAVSALAEKVKIPNKILHTLEGESLINDASGLVSFQFAVAALLTGVFSFTTASVSFVLISLGGILVGILISFLAMQLVRWLRSLGIESNVSFLLLELLLPFGIFLVAEHFGVNGILAAVSGGIVYSFSYQKVTPEVAQLNVLSKNTWSMLSFSLNGLVFVLLGTQLPRVIRVVWENNNINNVTLIAYILSTTAILLAIRFICFCLFRNFEKTEGKTSQDILETSVLYTISGVRGTITLVSALSLPIILGDGSAFMQRELMISIAGGVIITTLILANFAMPLFAEEKEVTSDRMAHDQEIAILREVILQLKAQETPENHLAIERVITMYNDRIMTLLNSDELGDSQDRLMEHVLRWKFADTLLQVTEGAISFQTAFMHLRRLNRRLYRLTRDQKYRNNMFYGRIIRKKLRFIKFRPLSFEERRAEREYLQDSNRTYVLNHLQELEPDEYPQELVDFYFARLKQRGPNREKSSVDSVDEWLTYAIQLERDGIQDAFEQGDINRNELRVYRENLLAIENTVQYIG
ncbi:Na+/H+ antiporter [Vagococcus intermedius]|uniref:Na+/H+ antiporter n=1 Tax=Vagococcus intermedius TaxID=2991418 RepID=A0AAF0I6B2_9ENTE|nr:Na+/H+ antiporter [Vagococcus intermedius]WEG73483.1 Na+/H+ antiporter [Vagococcus intermedius]WEG75567.1 Na+/H+ antiporter [Vagococcus intermedius]